MPSEWATNKHECSTGALWHFIHWFWKTELWSLKTREQSPDGFTIELLEPYLHREHQRSLLKNKNRRCECLRGRNINLCSEGTVLLNWTFSMNRLNWFTKPFGVNRGFHWYQPEICVYDFYDDYKHANETQYFFLPCIYFVVSNVR